MRFDLRDDQRNVVARAVTSIASGGKPLIVAPTGSGKTVMLAELAAGAVAAGYRVLLRAHRLEICEQLKASAERHLEQPVGMITSEHKAIPAGRVVVAMNPTLARRPSMLREMAAAGPWALFSDEAHHAEARTWRMVEAVLSPRNSLGATATPIRNGNRPMTREASGFTELIQGPSPAELMKAGALSGFEIFSPKRARVDANGEKVEKGEYKVTENTQRKLRALAGHLVPDWRRLNPDALPTIVVAANVAHAEDLEDRYRSAGIDAAAIFGHTAKGHRRSVMASFRGGNLTVLISVAVIDEGLDVPAAKCLQITRLIRSWRLGRQYHGRVLRRGRPAIIIDHTANHLRKSSPLPFPDADIKWRLDKESTISEAAPTRVVEDADGRLKMEALPVPEEGGGVMGLLRRSLWGDAPPADGDALLARKVALGVLPLSRDPTEAVQQLGELAKASSGSVAAILRAKRRAATENQRTSSQKHA